MTHGGAGDFNINMPLSGTRGVECRTSASLGTANYTIVFTFSNTLTSVGGASPSESGCGTIGVSNSTISGSDYIVNLTGVCNAQYVTVTLTNVNDSVGDHSDSVPGPGMGFLIGDVNASGRVDAADVSLVRQQTLQPVTTSNFREDINASGRIDAADVSVARQQTLTSLPSPP
jgi:Dockerin type I domain